MAGNHVRTISAGLGRFRDCVLIAAIAWVLLEFYAARQPPATADDGLEFGDCDCARETP